MITDSQIADLRNRLNAERTRLLEQVAARTPSERAVGWNPDRADLASDYVVKDRQLALLSVERQTLDQIEGALDRIEWGTYGLCSNCGRPIDPARLEALPYATLCIRCQRAQDG